MTVSHYVEAPRRYSPEPGDPPSVFLAGGISDCPDWQREAAGALRDLVVFNPRRAGFDLSDPAASEAQIAWEFHHLRLADVTLFWFPASDPAVTTQPITLYELGAAAATPDRLIAVGVDPGYPRATDVRCQLALVRPGLSVHDALPATVAAARAALNG
ncbi:nucleoside 2-deoxyribosyltransferase domain-containing protein [Streptomyces sp. NPDC127098]|uniref:nucleoside 2-deoxyribosyltransferase domain-containing protein n=1 Tax=Streptomyces sp. NPDC127098 TaxID=3347137 RepID=UPI00365301F8